MKLQSVGYALVLGFAAWSHTAFAADGDSLPPSLFVQTIDFHAPSDLNAYSNDGGGTHYQRIWGGFSHAGLECDVFFYSKGDPNAGLPKATGVIAATGESHLSYNPGMEDAILGVSYSRFVHILFKTADGSVDISCQRFSRSKEDAKITINDINAAFDGQLVVGATRDEMAMRVASTFTDMALGGSNKFIASAAKIEAAGVAKAVSQGSGGTASMSGPIAGSVTAVH
ncbi:MAG: hypothetical protein HY074_16365 [Deltaproteobacteria bacterium]|nr:hypothetical protein [Deltaproteobacteria bacterium]